MSDLLTGGEISGTPIETRGGTAALGQDLLSPGGRLQRQATTGAIGFDPTADIESAVQRLLTDPADNLRGLFAALQPFEERAVERTRAGTRGSFGQLGARFSRNLLDAESRAVGELEGNFARSREQSVLEAGGQQSQLIQGLLQAILGSRGQTLDFFQPGAPSFREGILGDLIAAAGLIGATQIGGGDATTATARG